MFYIQDCTRPQFPLSHRPQSLLFLPPTCAIPFALSNSPTLYQRGRLPSTSNSARYPTLSRPRPSPTQLTLSLPLPPPPAVRPALRPLSSTVWLPPPRISPATQRCALFSIRSFAPPFIFFFSLFFFPSFPRMHALQQCIVPD